MSVRTFLAFSLLVVSVPVQGQKAGHRTLFRQGEVAVTFPCPAEEVKITNTNGADTRYCLRSNLMFTIVAGPIAPWQHGIYDYMLEDISDTFADGEKPLVMVLFGLRAFRAETKKGPQVGILQFVEMSDGQILTISAFENPAGAIKPDGRPAAFELGRTFVDSFEVVTK